MRRRPGFQIILARLCLLLPSLAMAAMAAPAEPAEPAKVMLMGLFHFANPGKDMVKGRVIDVLRAPNQTYLDALAVRLTKFRPTDVLVECSPSAQGKFDERFRAYLAGRFVLPSNEIYQIGFRVAKRASLSRVTCFDEDEIGWNAQPMFDYIEKHEPQVKQDVDARFQSLSASLDEEQSTLSLAQLLRLANDPRRDAGNKALYLLTNDVDAGGRFAGADAAASWWHRNFRMYANIQKAAAPGRRVIALAGQGHTAVMKDLLAVDERRQAEDVRVFLNDDRRARGSQSH
ncbi:MAG: DUF5694 domain-containing protein [Lysobacterales bacterium]